MIRPQAQSPLRVLVVVDQADDFDLARGALARLADFRCEVRWAATGASARQMLDRDVIDLVVVDQHLRARNGLEGLAELFDDRACLPVVLLGSHGDPALVIPAAGVTRLERAALDTPALAHAVRDALERGRTERELRSAQAFFQAGFDALQEHVAILDAEGGIVAVNAAWRRFGRENGAGDRAWIGMNYLATSAAAVTDRTEGMASTAASAVRGIRDVIAGQRAVFYLEYPCHAPNVERWFALRVVRFENAGRALAYVAHQDVTERYRADRALRTSEARYRRLVETSREGICTLDATGAITYANQRLATLLGYDPRELAGRRLFELMEPDAAIAAEARFARRQLGVGQQDELALRRRDGTTMWANEATSPLLGDDGTFQGAVYMFGDITERRAAQRKLAASERLFRALTENSSELVSIVAGDGTMRYANPAFRRAFGISTEELVGANAAGFIHPDDVPRMVRAFSPDLLPPGAVTTVEYRVQLGDGTWQHRRAIAENLLHDDAVQGIVLNSQDVTEQRRAEQALREQEEHYRMLFQRNPLPMWLGDGVTRRFLAVNDAAVAHYGYSREEFLAMRVDEIRPAEDREASVRIYDAVHSRENVGTHRHVKKDGTLVDVEIVADTVRFGDRDVRLVIAHDITARVRAAAEREELVRRLEGKRARLDALVQQMPFAVIIADAASRQLVMGNDHVDRVFGHALRRSGSIAACQAEWVGFHADGRQVAPHEWPIARALARGEEVRGEVYRYPRPAEPNAWVRLSAAPIRDANGHITAAILAAEDITAQRATEAALRDSEDRLRQSQKMEAVGRLAGGVAHDFNNLLTVITGYTALLLVEMPEDDPIAADLREVQAAAYSAAGLTRQLLAFSRQQVLQPRVIDLRAVVGDMEQMLRRLIGEDVAFTMGTASGFPCGGAASIVADAGQIAQVVMNLVVNARDAMPAGGRLSIEIDAATLTGDDIACDPCVVRGEYVRMRVRDTGCGMDARTQAQAFDPFFTTKDPGKGTGLGLATVYGIVKQSGGYIWVESVPDVGSTFVVLLPCADGSVEGSVNQAGWPLEVTRRRATVLVVEDEEALRALLVRVLGRRGYRVLAAASGAEALALAAAHEDRIHLLVTDVVMPQMSGQELAERLVRLDGREIPVLFISGYSSDAVSNHGVLRAAAPLLQKPFTPADLVLAVSELLQEHPDLATTGEHAMAAAFGLPEVSTA